MLSPGGAERVASIIVRGLNRERMNRSRFVHGRLESDLDRLLEEAGIEVRYLGKRPGFDYAMYQRLPGFSRLRPTIVQHPSARALAMRYHLCTS